MGKSIAILIGCLALAGFIAFGAWISLKNQIIAMEENVNGQWAQIENQLKRRNDLIPNFVSTVKGYAAHEMKAIETITAAREKLASGNLSQADRMKAEGEVGAAISRLLVISESNPELKANANFISPFRKNSQKSRISMKKRWSSSTPSISTIFFL